MRISRFNGSSNIAGERIRIARKQRGLSQEQLAAKLQLQGLETNQRTISRLEIGLRIIPDYELPFFASALNVSLDWLLKRD